MARLRATQRQGNWKIPPGTTFPGLIFLESSKFSCCNIFLFIFCTMPFQRRECFPALLSNFRSHNRVTNLSFTSKISISYHFRPGTNWIFTNTFPHLPIITIYPPWVFVQAAGALSIAVYAESESSLGEHGDPDQLRTLWQN